MEEVDDNWIKANERVFDPPLTDNGIVQAQKTGRSDQR